MRLGALSSRCEGLDAFVDSMAVDPDLEYGCTCCLVRCQVDRAAHSHICRACGTQYDALYCGACDQPYLNIGTGLKSNCPHCGTEAKRKSLWLATFGDIESALPPPGPVLSRPHEISRCFVVDGAGWAPDIESTVRLVLVEDGIGFISDLDNSLTQVPLGLLTRLMFRATSARRAAALLEAGLERQAL